MHSKDKTLCFSGHKKTKLPREPLGKTTLETALSQEIDLAIAAGIESFIIGGCDGFDLLAATSVLLRKHLRKPDEPPIELIVVLPFAAYSACRSQEQQELFQTTLQKCDQILTLERHCTLGCYRRRDDYLVAHSRRLVCYYNGSAYTIKAAQRAGVQVVNLYFGSLL